MKANEFLTELDALYETVRNLPLEQKLAWLTGRALAVRCSDESLLVLSLRNREEAGNR